MHRTWSYLVNPFLMAALRGYKVAYAISLHTDSALFARSADPDIAALYAYYHPLHTAFETAYIAWQTQEGTQEGATLTVDQLLFEMAFGDELLGISSKLNDWDFEVQRVYRKGTANYKSLFPDGHLPFQTGDKDERINAVKALSTKLGDFGDPILVALKVVVDAFLTTLDNARIAQKGEITITGTDSSQVNVTMISAMTGLMSVYGGLVQKYSNNLPAIHPFFDEETIRNFRQMEWDRTVAPSAAEFVFKRTIKSNRKVKVTVFSDKAVHCYVADEKNDPERTKFVIVDGLEDEIIEWDQLTETPDSTFFKIKNPDGSVPAHVKIEILPEGE